MTEWKVLVTAPYMQPALDRFKPLFRANSIEIVAPPVKERCDEEELLSWVQDIDGAICGDDRFTERVLQAAPRLKVISKWGTGIDSIDLDACDRLGIAVKNTPNAFSEPVADSVLGYVLCFARELPQMTESMRRGKWKKRSAVALNECTLGVIGVGNVGKAVVRRAVAFGMQVMGNDLLETPADFIEETGIRMVDKETLLRKSDFVSLNCDLNSTSYHLLGRPQFSMMKTAAIVINTARGPIIDEPALIEALGTGQIAGAALDVFEDEPLPTDSPLRRMDNVMLAPHNANSSPMAWERVHQRTIANLIESLQGSTK